MTDKTAPERIWLQTDGDYEATHEAMLGTDTGVTWCDTPQSEDDQEYVRADIHAAAVARVEAANASDAEVRGLSKHVEGLIRAELITAQDFQIAGKAAEADKHIYAAGQLRRALEEREPAEVGAIARAAVALAACSPVATLDPEEGDDHDH